MDMPSLSSGGMNASRQSDTRKAGSVAKSICPMRGESCRLAEEDVKIKLYLHLFFKTPAKVQLVEYRAPIPLRSC